MLHKNGIYYHLSEKPMKNKHIRAKRTAFTCFYTWLKCLFAGLICNIKEQKACKNVLYSINIDFFFYFISNLVLCDCERSRDGKAHIPFLLVLM